MTETLHLRQTPTSTTSGPRRALPDLPAEGLPLTPGQASIWYGQSAREGSSVYQCAELLFFDGEIEVDLLARVIPGCLVQLPALQSAFVTGAHHTPRMVPDPHDLPVHRATIPEETDPLDWAAEQVKVPAMVEPGILRGDQLTGHTLASLPHGRWVWLARFHHIVGDGFAIHAIIRWIAESYRSELAGEPWPEPPFQEPAEALRRHQEYESSAYAEQDRQFWAQTALALDPAGLSPRPARPAEDLHTAQATISPTTRRALRSTARAHGAGETELIAAAIAHYTAVIGGAEETVLAVPLMNRPLGEQHTALEPRVNVLPLRLSSGFGLTLSEQLAEASTRMRDLREHGRYRAEQIRRDQRLADPSRRITGPGLNIKPFASHLRFGPATASLTTVALGPVEDAELLFQATPDGGFLLRVLTNSSAHTWQDATAHAQRIAVFLERLVQAAESAGADGDPGSVANTFRMDAVDLLLPQERRKVLDRFNATGHELTVPQGTTLTSWVLNRRACDLADPQRAATPALSFGTPEGRRTLNRAELWEQIDALAVRLAEYGVGPGVVVGVQLRRGPALPIALAAVVSCGAAWVPLDPDLPETRRAFMVETAGPAVLVIGADPAPDGAPEQAVIRLDEQSMTPATDAGLGRADEPLSPALPDGGDLAYVLFTSGSTGRPKGVAVPQKAIVNRLDWMAADYAIDEHDIIIQKTPCSFDVSVWEFMLPFTHGPQMAVAAEGAHRDPAALSRELRQAEVTTCHFVPSALKAFLDGSGVTGSQDLPALRQVFASGEALTPGLAGRFAEALGVQLHNLYGPTEAAVDVTAHTFTPGETEVPIGAPVWNTRCYVLDAALRPVPVGVAGQLYLAGVQLAQGYVGRADLTAERFLPDPFSRPDTREAHSADDAHGRMYATGDIARWRDDGALVYLGRADSQVKLRGQRIELAEIESVLASHPAVSQCAVLAREVAAEQMLIGYVVLKSRALGGTGALDEDLEADLRAHMARMLPSYMVPSALLAIDALPTTLNGKLDAGNLPLPSRGQTEFAAAQTPLEHTVQQVFADVLELPQVSATENFFDAGGNSLSAVRLAHEVEQASGAGISIADIFAAPTPRALASRIGSTHAAAQQNAFGPLLALREHRGGVPVFCLHPAGGLGWSYAGLLPHLDRERGVFALQSPGILDPGHRAQTLQQAAESAADVMVEVLGSLPGRTADDVTSSGLDLVGWSVGGVIAQAAAAVLERRGVCVRRLCLMDAYPAEQWRNRPAPTQQQRLRGLLIMAGVDEPEGAGEASPELTQETVVSAIRETGSPFGSLPANVLGGVIEMVGHNARLMREHRSSACPQRIQFFKAGLNPEDLDETAWEPHTGGLNVIELPCTHPGMVSGMSLRRIAEFLA